MTSSFPPGLVLLLGALVVPFLKGKVRAAWLLLLPVAGFANLLVLPDGSFGQYGFLGFGAEDLTFVRIDTLSRVFGYIFHIAAFLGVLYALHVKDRLQQVSALVYAGSAVGAVFAGDLVTLFLHWEVVGVSSVFLILARRTPGAYAAGMRYVLWQLLSGLLLLFGIALHVQSGGSAAFGSMTSGLMAGEAGALLIFLAFGVKCGWPIFHTWFVDAYPHATPTGTVFLSAFTTKLAVYALVRGFPGAEPLIWIGTAMALFPIFYAVIENDLRRVLCYSMVNQIGFMVVGIGIGTEMALDGAVAHAFADILFKGLLFMSMGAVLLRTGRINGTDLGGLYRSMPWTATFCLVGAASISAFPLFSAFVTKSLIMMAAAEQGHTFVWFCLLFASAGVLEHAGIKIPFFSFFAHDSGLRPREAPRNMLFAMGLASAACITIGCFPRLLWDLLPFQGAGATFASMYSITHVITQLQLLVLAALAVFWLMRAGVYPPERRAINIDADWLTRRGGRAFLRFAGGPLQRALGGMSAVLNEKLPAGLQHFVRNPPGAMRLAYDRFLLGWAGAFRSMGAIDRAQQRLQADQVRYVEARPGAVWPIGTIVLYSAIAFVIFLLVYLL
jgi:multicomponent Na+:H+ antiporter subunit D